VDINGAQVPGVAATGSGRFDACDPASRALAVRDATAERRVP
jgi:hypothetical protein